LRPSQRLAQPSFRHGPDLAAWLRSHVRGAGGDRGRQVNISAPLKGRIWSHAAAKDLKHWRDWCDSVGAKMLDDTISIDKVIGQFILPERLTGRPSGVALAVEWPWQIHTMQADSQRLSFQDLTPTTSSPPSWPPATKPHKTRYPASPGKHAPSRTRLCRDVYVSRSARGHFLTKSNTSTPTM
jgi:hypothetical protein